MTLQLIDENGKIKTYEDVIDWSFYDKDNVITELNNNFDEFDFEDSAIESIYNKVKQEVSSLDTFPTLEEFSDIVVDITNTFLSSNDVKVIETE